MQITIRHERKSYAKVVAGDMIFRTEALGLFESGWFWGLLIDRADLSTKQAQHHQQVSCVLEAAELLATKSDWLKVVNLPLAEIATDQVVTAFKTLERHLSGLSASKNQKHLMSIWLRKWVVDYLELAGIPRIQRIRSLFKTTLCKERGQPRALISDFASDILEGEIAHPVGAMPHSNSAELRSRIRLRLVSDVERVTKACMAELETVCQLRRYVEERLRLPVRESTLSQVRKFTATTRAKSSDWSNIPALQTLLLAELEVCYCRLAYEQGAKPGSHMTRCYFRESEIIERIEGAAGLGPTNRGFAKFVLEGPLGGIQPLVGCIVLIQAQTGWNVGSVFELTADQIIRNGDRYEIQSFKNKTDDFTPHAVVKPGDFAFAAIEFLLERLSGLKRLGWAPATESRLWLNASRARSGELVFYGGWARSLKNLQAKHGLPAFSFEQMRNQVMTSEAVVAGGLEVARRKGGQSSLSMAAHYQDQLVMQRLNSSVNLEFQDRIASSVAYRFDSSGWSEAEFDRMDLLYPIGDGTSCANPSKPPSDDQLDGETCSAKLCHQGVGCPQRRIVINEARIEEALRTTRFYNGNWKRLLDENEDAFREHHMPSLALNFSLVRILERGPYRHVVKRVDRALQKEWR